MFYLKNKKAKKFIFDLDGLSCNGLHITLQNYEIDELVISSQRKEFNLNFTNCDIKKLTINSKYRYELNFDYIPIVRLINTQADILSGNFDKLICESYINRYNKLINTDLVTFLKNKEVINYHYKEGNITLTDRENFLKENEYFIDNQLLICEFFIKKSFNYLSENNQKLLIEKDENIPKLSLISNDATLKINGDCNSLKIENNCTLISNFDLENKIEKIHLRNVNSLPDNLKKKVYYIELENNTGFNNYKDFTNLSHVFVRYGFCNLINFNSKNLHINSADLQITNSEINNVTLVAGRELDINCLNSKIENIKTDKSTLKYVDLTSLNPISLNIRRYNKPLESNDPKILNICKKYNIPFIEQNLLSDNII